MSGLLHGNLDSFPPETMRSILAFAAASLFAASLSAQCATLAVTGTGAPGTTLTFALDGSSANAVAFLVVGATQGSQTLPIGPLGTVTLGVAMPFLPLPLGPTDANGDVSLAAPVPSAATMGLDLFAQGLTIGFTLPTLPPTLPPGGGIPSFGFSLCASNVVGFHFGS